MILPFLTATIQEKIAAGKSRDEIAAELKSHGYSMEDLVDTWASIENPVLTPDAKKLDFVVTATPIEARKGPAQPLMPAPKPPPTAPAPPAPSAPLPATPLPPLPRPKQQRSGPSIIGLIISFLIIPFLGGVIGYILSQTSWNFPTLLNFLNLP